MFASLKSRLAVGSFFILASLLAGCGLLLYYWLSLELETQLQESLRVVAKGAAGQASVEHDFLEIYHNKVDQYLESSPSLLLQIINTRGVVLYGPDAALPGFDYTPAQKAEEVWRKLDWNGIPILALKYTFSAAYEHGYGSDQDKPYYASVIIALDRRPDQETLAHFRTILVIVVVSGSLLGAALLTLLSYLTTKPLDELAKKIDAIDHQKLIPLTPVPNLPCECDGIFDELNVLINRVEKELLRERTFTANISHELRTPLTGLRSTLEVSQQRDKTPAEFKESQDTCLKIVLETQRLVNELLRLRRLESGNYQPDCEEAELTECLQASWDNFAERAKERQLTCTRALPEAIRLYLPLDLFLSILNNLIENAVEYATEGTEISMLAQTQSDTWTLVISNKQSGLEKASLEKLFDPFWRGDQARAATGSHAGLGLSIVQTMVRHCGMTIEPSLNGDTFTMTLSGRLRDATDRPPSRDKRVVTGA